MRGEGARGRQEINTKASRCAMNLSQRLQFLSDPAARYLLPNMLVSCVTKRATPTTFVVEHTNYGWSVGTGTERMGLFVTQRQALDEVKRRRAELTAKGQRSTLVVTGSESSSTGNRTSRPYWSRR